MSLRLIRAPLAPADGWAGRSTDATVVARIRPRTERRRTRARDGGVRAALEVVCCGSENSRSLGMAPLLIPGYLFLESRSEPHLGTLITALSHSRRSPHPNHNRRCRNLRRSRTHHRGERTEAVPLVQTRPSRVAVAPHQISTRVGGKLRNASEQGFQRPAWAAVINRRRGSSEASNKTIWAIWCGQSVCGCRQPSPLAVEGACRRGRERRHGSSRPGSPATRRTDELRRCVMRTAMLVLLCVSRRGRLARSATHM